MVTDASGSGDSGIDDAARVLTDGVLAHYGIPGMKWGRRRSREELSDAREVTATVKDGKGVVKTSGGKLRPASDDAIAAKSHRQVAKASTTDALSNKELQELVTRMNLEQQYARLAGPQQKGLIGQGAAFLTRHLSDKDVTAPIGDLISAVPQTSKHRGSYDKIVLGAKVLNPILNQK